MSVITSLDSFPGLVAFVATVEAGSFAAAGRKLGLSASAVGKSVARLESRLSVKLLQRTTRSIALTGEGEMLHAQSSRILEELRDLEAAISRGRTTPRGRLKVSVPTVVGRRKIVPALPGFLEQYPDVELDIWLDDQKVDIIEEGYDLVLRLGDLESSGLSARNIGPHSFLTCGAPAYFAKHGVPRTPHELAMHQCIRYRYPSTGRLEEWAFKGTNPSHKPGRGLPLNDGEALATAARAGLGVIQAPKYLVADDIAEGRLQVVLDEYTCNRGSLWLVWPYARAQVPRVRVFADFLADLLGSH